LAKREDLQEWVKDALLKFGGRGRLVAIAKEIWETKEQELRGSGDLFYTWQYDMRWAATKLRQNGIMRLDKSRDGIWELV
jgi:hypothetical protein